MDLGLLFISRSLRNLNLSVVFSFSDACITPCNIFQVIVNATLTQLSLKMHRSPLQSDTLLQTNVLFKCSYHHLTRGTQAQAHAKLVRRRTAEPSAASLSVGGNGPDGWSRLWPSPGCLGAAARRSARLLKEGQCVCVWKKDCGTVEVQGNEPSSPTPAPPAPTGLDEMDSMEESGARKVKEDVTMARAWCCWPGCQLSYLAKKHGGRGGSERSAKERVIATLYLNEVQLWSLIAEKMCCVRMIYVC